MVHGDGGWLRERHGNVLAHAPRGADPRRGPVVDRDEQRVGQRAVERRASLHGGGHPAAGPRDPAGARGQHHDVNAHVHVERCRERHAVPAVGRRQLGRAHPNDLHRGAGRLRERDGNLLTDAQRDAERRCGSVVDRDEQCGGQRAVERSRDLHAGGHPAPGRGNAGGAGGQHRDVNAHVHVERGGERDAVSAVARRQLGRPHPHVVQRGASGLTQTSA